MWTSKNHWLAARRHILWWMGIFLGLGLGLTVGCGGDETTGTDEQPSSPDITEESDAERPDPGLMDFATRTAGAMCEKAFECCNEAERAALLGDQVESQEDCADFAAFRSFVFGYGMLDESVKAGRIKVNASLIDLCIESIAAASCEDFATSPDLQAQATGCREVLMPQVDHDSGCQFDEDCQSGYCAESTGTCRNLPRNGEDCRGAMRCEPDHFCDTFNFTCERKRPDGEVCMDDDECASERCIEDDDQGLICGESPATCAG